MTSDVDRARFQRAYVGPARYNARNQLTISCKELPVSHAAEAPASIPVPPLNLAANFREVRVEVLRELTEICDSGYYVLGPKVAAFEEQFAAACGARFAIGLSSGTDALLAALMTLGIGRGDEVIVPTFTFFATAGVVERIGARPVFADIDPATFNIDPAHVAELITQRTRAVIPVHLYGRMAEMRPIFDACNRHGIHVIEDAAQAIGATHPDFPDRTAGAIGAFGAISFYPTKNLGAIGDAGALLTNSEEHFARAKQCRLHGETTKYHHEFVGGNFRIDAMQAAILSIKLKHLDSWNARRAAVATRYRELLQEFGLVGEHVTPPEDGPGRHVYHQFVLRAARRDALLKHLQEQKIGAGVYYPVPLHLQACFAQLGGREGQCPNAEQAAREVLALPIYPELTEDQQRTVVRAIREFYGR